MDGRTWRQVAASGAMTSPKVIPPARANSGLFAPETRTAGRGFVFRRTLEWRGVVVVPSSSIAWFCILVYYLNFCDDAVCQ